ncbi:MAG: hypothetical protein OEV40_29265 [Acidimicrobiia bacterium]|nr:hypothetical protein [Acidimicrobiia bacterium]
MAKKAPELDTPFRRGEKVLTTRNVDDIEEGTEGRVQLTNGLGNWRRYWVKFDGDLIRGQVSHEDLVRPDQLEEWLAREEAKSQAAIATEQAALDTAAESDDDSGSGNGVASRIPAHLLERSKAAKARLLG